ncbi:MAG TPA: glycosyltransferase family 2 protein [Syntrophales bacterium]|nr:glycosyltransferase family 2 protein [Syntrophales bacterium]
MTEPTCKSRNAGDSQPPDVSIVIVSYNTADLIGRCLESVFASRDCRTEVFVADNASADGSTGLIRTGFPQVRLIANADNRGFGAACNQGLSLCRGRYVLFLNPDASLQPDALSRAVSAMDRSPFIGLAGLRILNPDGTLQPSVSYRYPGQRHCRDELQDLPGRIACVLGAAMLARADILHGLGGFDEDFFLYGEDQDLCLRIRRKGYEIGYVKEAVAVHIGAQSERSTAPEDLMLRKIRAEYLFYEKHYRPDTVGRIRKAELLKARWRLLTLKLSGPFTRDREKTRAKETRYRLIAREAKSPHRSEGPEQRLSRAGHSRGQTI